MFGFPEDKFIIAFVGHFIERKGFHFLLEAIEEIPDSYLICAGKGPITPIGDNILHSSLVNPDDLSYFYSSADVFVLPTLNEGCCNAIIEAMACGLPIISSNRSFNYDILDDSNSIMINPEDVNEIAEAINIMKNDPKLRKSKSIGSIRKAENLKIEQRALNIINFMEEMIKNNVR
jgi:teichuronic acid biosynthesis glycosyltransferase TuaC